MTFMLAPPTFSLAPQCPPHFFNSRIATAGNDVAIQLHTSHPHGESPFQMAAAASHKLGGLGWAGFINDLERYLHCDWLKTSCSDNKVTFCKYANRTRVQSDTNNGFFKLIMLLFTHYTL